MLCNLLDLSGKSNNSDNGMLIMLIYMCVCISIYACIAFANLNLEERNPDVLKSKWDTRQHHFSITIKFEEFVKNL